MFLQHRLEYCERFVKNDRSKVIKHYVRQELCVSRTDSRGTRVGRAHYPVSPKPTSEGRWVSSARFPLASLSSTPFHSRSAIFCHSSTSCCLPFLLILHFLVIPFYLVVLLLVLPFLILRLLYILVFFLLILFLFFCYSFYTAPHLLFTSHILFLLLFSCSFCPILFLHVLPHYLHLRLFGSKFGRNNSRNETFLQLLQALHAKCNQMHTFVRVHRRNVNISCELRYE
jgi:hypothetical protein